jgi:hypothetical protein
MSGLVQQRSTSRCVPTAFMKMNGIRASDSVVHNPRGLAPPIVQVQQMGGD